MPTPWVVQISGSAQDDLDRIPAKDRLKVLRQLTTLEKTPFLGPHIKKLKAKAVGQWRLEIWPYRVRYDVEGNEVIIYRIRHRKDIYKN